MKRNRYTRKEIEALPTLSIIPVGQHLKGESSTRRLLYDPRTHMVSDLRSATKWHTFSIKDVYTAK